MPMSDLSEVLKPVETARGLPNAHYVSDEMFEREKRDVLFANWSSIGFGRDIPDAGDVMPVNFVGMPLLAVRTKTGEIKVFQNTCRHRGMILVEEKKNIGNGVIRCAYHSWCYAQTGELITTPHVGGPGQNAHEGIDRSTLGLTEIRSHVWMDIIFVNVSGVAPDFETYAADAIALWAEYGGQPMYGAGDDNAFKFDVACNWKLAVENYCESYHLPWVHPGLNSYSRLEDHYHIENPGHFSGQGTLVYRQLKGEGDQVFPDFPDLSAKWETGGEYIALYPNTLIGVQRDHAFGIVLEPVAKDRTIEHVALLYATQEAATGASYSALRKENARLWYGVFKEDVFVVEGMQKGRHAIHFDGGKFSPAMDGPTHCFHHWVASQLMSERIAAE